MTTRTTSFNPPEPVQPSDGPIAVTGATGFVGRHLVRELRGRGYTVRALVRSQEKAARVFHQDEGVHLIEGSPIDGPDHDALLARFAEGAAAGVHLMGILRETGGSQTFDRVHLQSTRRVVRAFEGAGVSRYLHMSALGVRAEGACKYQKTKWDAEQVVFKSSLAWTIFRPSLIHGADGELMGQIKGWCQGSAAPFLFLPYFTRVTPPRFEDGNPIPKVVETPEVEPVYVGDVAKAFADALTTPESADEIYHLTGPERLAWPALLETVRDALPLSRGLKPVGLPGHLAAAGALKAKMLGMGGALPFDAGMAMMAMEDSVADHTKAEQHLAFAPRPFTPLVREYAGSI